MSQSERVRRLNSRNIETRSGTNPIGYWIHATPRVHYNHALEYAVHLAKRRDLDLFCFFVVTTDYPDATQRHLRFLLEGVFDLIDGLAERGISCCVYTGDPAETAVSLSHRFTALVTDRGYSRTHGRWYSTLAEAAACPIYQVESNIVVPVEVASEKEEYSAATIRRKIERTRDRFIVPLETISYSGFVATPPEGRDVPRPIASSLPKERETLLRNVAGVSNTAAGFPGGERAARARLDDFLEKRLDRYDALRNVPDLDWSSHLSPYLHFGQISPVEIAIRTIDYAEMNGTEAIETGTASFLEELIVRRELAINFVRYNDQYDSYDSLPRWARETLDIHRGDTREYAYDYRQLEQAETHDPYWNACQREMVTRGVMHGYMRMYWGKKILEWSSSPEEAYATALHLNDRWELDGRDPNGWAGVAWCFGKHDRPWSERSVFGKVRYMNDAGLRRKFKSIDLYVARWASD